LYQSRLQAERGIRRQAAQAQGSDPRHQEHRARRGDQLRLRHRLLQGLPEADRLQMRGLRKEAQEEARRSAGGKAAAESQGREEGAEKGRKAGGKSQAEAAGNERRKAERQGEWSWPRAGPTAFSSEVDTGSREENASKQEA